MSAGKLPEGWTSTPVSTVTTLIRGVTYKKEQAINYLKDNYLPLIRANNIQNGKFDTTNLVFVPKNLVKESQKISPEDIVIAMSSGSKSVVGKSAHQHLPFECSFGAFCGALRPEKSMLSGFVAHFTKSSFYRNKISSLSAGANINNIKPASFDLINIPIPSLAEQKIIAEKLDSLLAQVDSTKARLEKIPKILKRFRQAVLASAVRGKLTDDWLSSSKVVDAESLLKEIEIERDKAKDNRLIKPSFVKKKNISPLFEIPSDSWGWVGFEQICATNNNALKAGPFGSALKKADCVEDGYKVYGQEQVISGSESLETYRISDEKYHQLKSCTVGPGDILVSLVGTIGKVMVLSSQAEIGVINPRLVKITLHEVVNPKYIKIYLDSPIAHGFFKGFSHGGTMDILNLGILKELPITLPPKEEQAEIVRRVEQLFAYADTIEKQVNNALSRVNNLTQSILAKAFRGELTAQWRAENPELISGENSAAALLEKIKAERAASTAKKATRKKS